MSACLAIEKHSSRHDANLNAAKSGIYPSTGRVWKRCRGAVLMVAIESVRTIRRQRRNVTGGTTTIPDAHTRDS
jgi:hypothetical protein